MKSQVWWYTSVMPALGKLRLKDNEFEENMGYTAVPCLIKQNTNKQEEMGSVNEQRPWL